MSTLTLDSLSGIVKLVQLLNGDILKGVFQGVVLTFKIFTFWKDRKRGEFVIFAL